MKDDDAEEMRGRGRSTPSGGAPSRMSAGGIDPLNINEILRAQELALLKNLPEEDRKKFEESTRLFRSNGGKGIQNLIILTEC